MSAGGSSAHREKQAGQSRPGSAQRRSAWGPAAWRQQRREEEGGRLGGALLLGRADRRRGRAHGRPRAGGRGANLGRQRTRRGIRGEGDAYIGMVESFWLARQGKKNGPGCWFGLKRFFFYFLFFAKRFNKFDLN